jgi:deoxycytidylate deaminase
LPVPGVKKTELPGFLPAAELQLKAMEAKGNTRPSWDEYFMEVAHTVSKSYLRPWKKRLCDRS